MHPEPTSTATDPEPPSDAAADRPPVDQQPFVHAAAEPADTDPEPEPDPHLARIDATLAAITERLERNSERAAHRERVIDRQHAEIERLRAAERSGLLRPVVTDLCRLRNDLLRQAGTVPAQMTGTQVSTLLASFADVVEGALDRCGVAVLATGTGSPFAPGHQQVVGSVDVAEQQLDNTVAAVLGDGYFEIDGGRIVVPARVTLHRARPAPAQVGARNDTGTEETTDE